MNNIRSPRTTVKLPEPRTECPTTSHSYRPRHTNTKDIGTEIVISVYCVRCGKVKRLG